MIVEEMVLPMHGLDKAEGDNGLLSSPGGLKIARPHGVALPELHEGSFIVLVELLAHFFQNPLHDPAAPLAKPARKPRRISMLYTKAGQDSNKKTEAPGKAADSALSPEEDGLYLFRAWRLLYIFK
ncbi:MAG: hypothetical protein LBP61_08160 [Desulfovibrio sp.]|jgi:hypothetical protein|nr:hypothetical protein [Desulfovibrio sp.]